MSNKLTKPHDVILIELSFICIIICMSMYKCTSSLCITIIFREEDRRQVPSLNVQHIPSQVFIDCTHLRWEFIKGRF